MFIVGREIHFSYGHRLLDHAGDCCRLHGHNGRVTVEIAASELGPGNMVLDFAEIRKTIGDWIKRELDHKTVLWERDELAGILRRAGEPVVTMTENPTAEALARWIYKEARALGLPVTRVTLWETENSFAVYHE